MAFDHREDVTPLVHELRPDFQIVLVSDPDAPRAARVALRGFGDALSADCLEVGALLLTEVVSNAVRYAGADDLTLSLWVRDGTLDALIADGGPGFVAIPPAPGASPVGGWGLRLLDMLALRWGSASEAPNSVWFELPNECDQTG
jgi:Signal transduction histidine kinase